MASPRLRCTFCKQEAEYYVESLHTEYVGTYRRNRDDDDYWFSRTRKTKTVGKFYCARHLVEKLLIAARDRLNRMIFR